ncbi:MAG: cell division protein FtsZ [Holosporales bacterium]|jgi:cell division protein FtsZ|nr:cell division protein FtsZ [Holosporales bacterium]
MANKREESAVGLDNGFSELSPKIVVIGVGGAGGNAVNNMIRSNLDGVSFVVANTDAQSLSQSLVPSAHRIQLGINITQGLGAGSKPDVGEAAAEESASEIMNFIKGSNMVFITAGMGGGTGTGAAPVIAKATREAGILTVGVITKPFSFEGANRAKIAERGIEELQQYVDTLIIIPNQNLFRLANENTTFADAFKMADNVLHSGVQGVTDLMFKPGLINLDFADIRTIMSEMGKAMMGTGEADGERRAIDAAEAAISNPLLDDVSLHGANGVLINITGGFDMTLYEVDEAANRIREEVETDANIIFGSTFDEKLSGKIRVSVVATGIGSVRDLSGFKRNDMVVGMPLKNSATASTTKMFEELSAAQQKVGANSIHHSEPEQPNAQHELSENYQEIRLDNHLGQDNNFDERAPQFSSKKSSFFDMFKSKSSRGQTTATTETMQQPSQIKKTIFQEEPLQQQPSELREKKQQQQPVILNEEIDDYDIPACFRRKK